MSDTEIYKVNFVPRAQDSKKLLNRGILVPRRHVLAGAGVLAGALALGQNWKQHAGAIEKSSTAVRNFALSNSPTLTDAMYIVAHPDDSLVFQSPDLLNNVQNNVNVFTVHLTAGDDGLGETYWAGRESGIQAAYAQMAGVINAWTSSTLVVGTHEILVETLTAAPNIQVAFMRLPDGGFPLGTGTALYNFQSLMQLANGSEPNITAVDQSTSYTLQDLINTIASMINSFQPQLISTMDFVNSYGDGDHMDHYATAGIVLAAHQSYSAPHNFLGYEGYPTTNLAANLTGTLLSTKQSIFYTYGAFDDMTCTSEATCAVTDYAAWLARQYIVGSDEVGVVANAGFAQTVAAGATVTLNGSQSSIQGGGTLTYAWTQTAGPSVTLSSASAVQPTFVAPAGPASLTFSLVVSNGLETSAPSTVTITVPSSTAVNIATLATATASSQDTVTGQLASSAIDGVISGYPEDTTAEWATVGGGVGSWLSLRWPLAYTVSSVVLFDRPNTDDQITSGTLTFSDGTVVSFASLPNDGTTGLTVTLSSPVTTTSVLMTVTGVSSTTQNVGLSEIEVYASAALTGDAPTANAGAAQTIASGGVVMLNGSASSDPNSLPLTYAWTQTAGPTVVLSSSTSSEPAFAAPTGPALLTFSLTVSNGTETSASSGVTVTVSAPVGTSNVATLATATASSQNTSAGQLASSAIDGVISGYPDDTTAEWATVGGGVGSWLKLTWTNAYTISSVVLYDRPNTDDQITSGTLTFSDGTVVSFASLPNDGTTGLTVILPSPVTTTTLLMTVTGVSATTQNVGLSEIQAFGSVASNADVPTANAGTAQTVASAALVQLNGAGSIDPKGLALTYVWTQTAGPSVTLSSSTSSEPTFVAPTGPTSLTFSLTVSNGSETSTPVAVIVTVSSPAGTSNVATLANATASSQNTATGQLASSAIDGIISGYPNNTTAEWATVGGVAGSWLKLTWSKAYTISSVVLFDRPNTDDQITSGTLTFSDGTVVSFASLPNDGTTGLTVTLSSPVTTTSMLMTVTGVSSTTQNVGLAEIQAFGISSSENADAPTASAGAAQTIASGGLAMLNGTASSDPNSLPLTYAWTQTAGPSVALSSTSAVQPTFVAPVGPTSLAFSLTVSNGTETSAPASVTVTVSAPVGTSNVATLATATASSQDTATGQLASSAIDGVISGYPDNTTAEWATVGGAVGSWLKLTWTKAYTISSVVLYDRPNTDDQVTSGTLTFSDGTVVSFASLPNDGTTGLTVTLSSPVTTTSMLMTVTGVSATTLNVGLAELQAYGVSS